MLYVKMERISRLKMLTDGWPTDGRRMPAYTISSPMSLRLRCELKMANFCFHTTIPFLLTGSLSCIINLTIMFLRFWIDKSGQKVKSLISTSTLIRFYCVCHFICIFRTHSCMLKPHCSNFRITTAICVSSWIRKPVYAICEQQRRRSACTSMQSD